MSLAGKFLVINLGKTVVLFTPRTQPPVQMLSPDLRVLIAKPAIHLHRPSCPERCIITINTFSETKSGSKAIKMGIIKKHTTLQK